MEDRCGLLRNSRAISTAHARREKGDAAFIETIQGNSLTMHFRGDPAMDCRLRHFCGRYLPSSNGRKWRKDG